MRKARLNRSFAAALAFCLLLMMLPLNVLAADSTADQKPAITNVSIVSNSAKGPAAATIGDIMTLTFTASEPVTKLGNFKINGSNPDSFDCVDTVKNVYTATHKVDAGDLVTGAPATFQINVKNAAGIYSTTIEQTTDNSSVTIVDQKPAISNVKITSNSVKGPSAAVIGDTITLTFTSDEPVTKLGNFKINGSNPDTFTSAGAIYTATHKVDAGDVVTGSPATFQINVRNAAGIYSTTIEQTTDGSSVTVTDQKPVISNVKIASNSAKGAAFATIGDTITLTFTSDEPVAKLGNFKINGSNPDSFTSAGAIYTATHKVDAGDVVNGTPATFQINVKNAAGIYSTTVEQTSDGSSVTIVDQKPSITNVKIASNNALGHTVAKIGDTITLTFTSDEPVSKLGNFKINGSNPDTFTSAGAVYTATHKVDAGDMVTGAPATFQINVKNAAGIYSTTIEQTSDGSSVTVYNEVSFNDVPANAWYNNAIGFMSAKGIVNGIGGSMFAPVNNVTRADFLVMVMKSYGIKLDTANTDNFADAGDKYYTDYLATAKRLGLVTGVGGNKYAPEATISRQDMLVILHRALNKTGELPTGSNGKTLASFKDSANIASYATDAMKLFVETGTISGDGKNLNPKAYSTRAEAAQVLYNLLSK